MSKKKFRKSVESIRRQIEIHYEKITSERQKSVPDENLIFYWQKEIAEALALATALGIPLKVECEALVAELNQSCESSRRVFQQ